MPDHHGFSEHFAIRMPDGNMFNYPGTDNVARWNDRAQAQCVLEQMRAQQRHFGVPDWRGEIVRQYVSPFIGDNDNADALLAELDRWLRQQTGGTQ